MTGKQATPNETLAPARQEKTTVEANAETSKTGKTSTEKGGENQSKASATQDLTDGEETNDEEETSTQEDQVSELVKKMLASGISAKMIEETMDRENKKGNRKKKTPKPGRGRGRGGARGK